MQTNNHQSEHGVIRGVREIAKYMGVSPTTIMRWRRRFRGKTDVKLCFPAMQVPTGRGWSWSVWTHTVLIVAWMARWCEIDGKALQNRAIRIRNPKVKHIGVTEKASTAGKEAPTLREELDQLTPAERGGWIIRNELTPAQCKELSVNVPEAPRTPAPRQPDPVQSKRCTCGQPEPCTAH